MNFVVILSWGDESEGNFQGERKKNQNPKSELELMRIGERQVFPKKHSSIMIA